MAQAIEPPLTAWKGSEWYCPFTLFDGKPARLRLSLNIAFLLGICAL